MPVTHTCNGSRMPNNGADSQWMSELKLYITNSMFLFMKEKNENIVNLVTKAPPPQMTFTFLSTVFNKVITTVVKRSAKLIVLINVYFLPLISGLINIRSQPSDSKVKYCQLAELMITTYVEERFISTFPTNIVTLNRGMFCQVQKRQPCCETLPIRFAYFKKLLTRLTRETRNDDLAWKILQLSTWFNQPLIKAAFMEEVRINSWQLTGFSTQKTKQKKKKQKALISALHCCASIICDLVIRGIIEPILSLLVVSMQPKENSKCFDVLQSGNPSEKRAHDFPQSRVSQLFTDSNGCVNIETGSSLPLRVYTICSHATQLLTNYSWCFSVHFVHFTETDIFQCMKTSNLCRIWMPSSVCY